MKVLIIGSINKIAEDIFKNNGIKFDIEEKLTYENLKNIIGNYEGILNRGPIKINKEVLSLAIKLKTIAIAGIGYDNIDVDFCREKGIVVMNSPTGNSISTAEHTIALLMAVTRKIPYANKLTKDGKWPKNECMGTELYQKTLGVIGCGNVGSRVIERGVGLKMNVISFDPNVTEEKIKKLGAKKVSLEELYKNSDFITFNVPLNDKTRGMLNKKAISKMKDGVYIVNSSRGGVMNEGDVKNAIESGKIAGVAMDVYSEEPAKDNILFKYDNVICTPHIGSGTVQAQINVAKQSAEQITNYLLEGKVRNRVN